MRSESKGSMSDSDEIIEDVPVMSFRRPCEVVGEGCCYIR